MEPTYNQLDLWQRSIELVEAIYLLTKKFPPQEQFQLTRQIQRATVAIPVRIAEGWGRSDLDEYKQYLSVASGSLTEIETCLITAARQGYVSEEEMKISWDLAQQVGDALTAMLSGMLLPVAKSKKIRSAILSRHRAR